LDKAEAGYQVDDTGVGCFMDVVAAHVPQARFRDIAAFDSFFETIADELKQSYQPSRAWADVVVDATTAANLVTFTTGTGDGIYPSYFGYSADSALVSLITDFGILHADYQ
jgi:hypothetical protein